MAKQLGSIRLEKLSEDLPNNFLKSEQFFTFLDLVSDGAEIEGFATPSKKNISIPESLLAPSSANDTQLTDDTERSYIQEAQKDIFLDGRAVRDFSGVENIQNTSLAIRTGTNNQEIMLGVDEQRSSANITAAKVLNNGNSEANKVTGTINAGPDLNSTPRAAIITLTWERIFQTSADDGSAVGLGINTGPRKGESGNVHILLRLRDKNNNLIHSREEFVNGVSRGQYSKDYRVDIPKSYFSNMTTVNNHFPLSVDVLRLDLEFRLNGGSDPRDRKGRNVHEEGDRRFTEFFFSGLQEVFPLNLIGQPKTNFPKSAYIGLRYSAEQFPNIPTRQYFIRGIKIRIPTGVSIDTADTGRIKYEEVNNYTFQGLTTDKHWTSDPAWILYALLTEDYGLKIDESKIDKASFYEASLYCSRFNSTNKPRYSFNGVINQRKKALDLIREVAGLMRATVYYKNGSIKIALDKPESVTSYLFTNANVVDGVFSYSGTDKDKKYTQINVSYFNNEIQEFDQISISSDNLDTSLKENYGLNQKNVRSLYTTDKNQAKRLGRSLIYSSSREAEIVSFECGLEAAAILEPFDVIKVADRLKENIRTSGRIKSAATVGNTTTIVVDDSTNTTLGVTGDSFLIIRKDGSLQESVIQTVSGSTITVSPAVSTSPDTDPIAGTIWAVKTGNVQHRKYRITNIKQKNNFVFSISAIVYDDNKYIFIDDEASKIGLGRNPTTLLDRLPAPQIQNLAEELIVVRGRATTRIVLNFSNVDGAKKYQVVYRFNSGAPIERTTTETEFVILNNKEGSYEFTVKSLNSANVHSTVGTTETILAVGLKANPNPVANLRAEESGDNLILKFDRSTDLDVLFGGFVDVKFSLISDGTATLQNANPKKRVNGNVNEIIFNDYQSGEYFLKFIDVELNESDTATSVVVNRTIASNNLLAAQVRENTGNFSGSKVNLIYDSSINGLRLTSAITFDSISNFDTLTTPSGNFATLDLVTADGGSGVPSEGIYTFAANNIDLGAPFRFHVEPHFKKSGFDTANLWDSYTDNMDDWPNIFTGSTTVLDKSADLVFQVAKSQTATASTTFETFVNTDMIARTLSFKVLVQNQSTYENVDIEELGVNLIFRPRTERSIDNSSATNGVLTSSGSGATTVTFAKKFFTGTTAVGGSTDKFKPVISININNMQDRDFFTIDSISTNNFVVSIKNGATGSFVARQFTYSAFGYGEG